MSKFRVGNLVKCIDNKGLEVFLTKGNFYKIISEHNENSDMIYVEGFKGPIYAYRFELVEINSSENLVYLLVPNNGDKTRIFDEEKQAIEFGKSYYKIFSVYKVLAGDVYHPETTWQKNAIDFSKKGGS